MTLQQCQNATAIRQLGRATRGGFFLKLSRVGDDSPSDDGRHDALDWLNLLRWRWSPPPHVRLSARIIVGIAWIGTSFGGARGATSRGATRRGTASAPGQEPPNHCTSCRRKRAEAIPGRTSCVAGRSILPPTGDPRRRVLSGGKIPRRAADAAQPAALVQVGGVQHVAERLRAARRAVLRQREHLPGRSHRRRHQPPCRRGHQHCPADRGLAGVRRAVAAARRARPAAGRGAERGHRGERVRREPRVQRAGELHPGGRDDRHLDGGQRHGRDHPGPARSWSPPSSRVASQTRRRACVASNARFTTTTSPCRSCSP